MKILVLDLAGKVGPIGNMRNSLEAKCEKTGDTVEFIEIPLEQFKYILGEKTLSWPYFFSKFPQTNPQNAILEYDQIIIASHGLWNDTTYCYHQEGATPQDIHKLCTHEQLADFFISFLQKCNLPENKPTNVTLAICYAARTERYDFDHLENRNDTALIEFNTSFAYRFLTQCSKQEPSYSINLSAYTGAVSFCEFGPNIGEILVETEDSILEIRPLIFKKQLAQRTQENMANLASFSESQQTSAAINANNLRDEIAELRADPNLKRIEYGKINFCTRGFYTVEIQIPNTQTAFLGKENTLEEIVVEENRNSNQCIPSSSIGK